MNTRKRDTLSFWLTLAGGVIGGLGYTLQNHALRKVGGGLLYSVGVAGLALTWHYWSLRCNAHMDIHAFARPVPLNRDDKNRLYTHSGQLMIGAALLW